MENYARHGWSSDFPTFQNTTPRKILDQLENFIDDASDEQKRAWRESISPLQREVKEILDQHDDANNYSTIMEYELPLDSRRPDVIFLTKGTVVVLELKGKQNPSQADLDQVSAYVRDLRCYHRACDNIAVIAICVPMKAKGYVGEQNGVHIMGPDFINEFVNAQKEKTSSLLLTKEDFLDEEAYRPLPTLVKAARELFLNNDLRFIKRARSATDPAVTEITKIIHEAALTKTRRLILLTGIPGAGKTLVGLRIAHAHFLDDLAIPRKEGKPSSPAVFLSGNGPLVEVLQYELRNAGGGGRTFVRGVKDYVKTYSSRSDKIPPEHVLIFDEAQRAFDEDKAGKLHSDTPGFSNGKSEPECFINFAERVPEWCVVIGLIGSGQEIHVGEEAGLGQWCTAIKRTKDTKSWTVHCPPHVASLFEPIKDQVKETESLNLNKELRFHLATEIHKFTENLLDGKDAKINAELAIKLESQGYHLRITNNLDVAKQYLRNRYAKNQNARFGLMASSKDKCLVHFDVDNDFQSTKRVHSGPWYSDDEAAPGQQSCRHLNTCVTEFGAQGLELDAALLAWGTDFIRKNGKWDNQLAGGYRKDTPVKNPYQLRLNSYRVLLTRGRDAIVVFVPDLPILEETWHYLVASGFKELNPEQSFEETEVPQFLSYQEAINERFKTALPMVAELTAGPLKDGMSTRSLNDARDLLWVRVPEEYIKTNRYVVKICGDSMEPTLQDGDLVVFEYHRNSRGSKQIVVVALDEFGMGSGSEIGSAVKRLYEEENVWAFHSDNSAYKKFSILKSECNYPILGTAVYNLTQYKRL